MNSVKKQVDNRLWHQVWIPVNKVNNHQIWFEIKEQIWFQIQVLDQVKDQVWNKTSDKLQ